jgi:acetyl esterase/lipase
MSPTSRTARRLLAAATIVALGRAVGRVVRRRAGDIADVNPELRSPLLYLHLEVTDQRRLAIGRVLPPIDGGAVAGVDIADHLVPRSNGGPDGDGLRVRVSARPDREPGCGALLWIHGGGMILGSAEQDDGWCSRLADELGIVVAGVDYRLAPEHPFPAALDDCMDALAWLRDSADELGVDPDRLAVGGASAGGGLAAAVAQRARDERRPGLCLQLLNYPMLDDRTVLRDDHAGRGVFIWTPVSNRFGWASYLGSEPIAATAPRYAAPARTTDLADLPPAWIGVGDLDLFHEEDVDYARRLGEAGVAVELQTVDGMYHGADMVARSAPTMRAYRQAMVDALGRAIG